MCQLPVPQESICRLSSKPCSAASCRNTPSALGERQMFPRQTNRTLTFPDAASDIAPSRFKQCPNPGQVFFGVHASRRWPLGNVHMDTGTVVQRPQWFQRLYLLGRRRRPGEDRKSTRLNSSHVRISYAVFCLKKKNTYLVD